MSGGIPGRGVVVSFQDEELCPQRRDLNLSELVRHIRDDGPAAVLTATPAFAAAASGSERAQGLPESADSDSPPPILVEPLSGGAVRSRKRRSIALAASAAVAVVTLGLALFFAGAGVQILPLPPWDKWLPGTAADQPPKPQGPLAEVPQAVAAISREENERIRQIQTLVAEGDRVDKERIARLEEQVAQTRRAQTELAALARRLELAARKAKEASAPGADPSRAAAGQVATDGGAVGHARGPASGLEPRKVEPSTTSVVPAPADALTAAVQSIAMQGKKRIAEGLASSAADQSSIRSREAEPEPSGQTAAPSSEAHAVKAMAAPVVSPGDVSASRGEAPVVGRLGSALQQGRWQAGPLRTAAGDPPKPKEKPQSDLAPSDPQMATAKPLALPVPTRGVHETAAGSGIPGVATGETAAAVQQSAPVPSVSPRETPAVKAPTQPAASARQLAKTPTPKKGPNPKAPELTDPFSETDSGGTWVINLVALSNRARAEAAQRRYQEKGFQTAVSVLRRSGSRPALFGVEIPGFSTRKDAAALVPTVKAKLGIKTVWIHQHR
jgi:hypothetical protein